jgi:hypothetical protein
MMEENSALALYLYLYFNSIDPYWLPKPSKLLNQLPGTNKNKCNSATLKIVRYMRFEVISVSTDNR